MAEKKYTDYEINLANMALAIGQINPNISSTSISEIIDYAKSFSKWEEESVLCLEDGWETYIENGGEDYESVIYEWAKTYAV